jgi:hypothetical protein
LNGGQQERDQDSNDRDHDEQLHEREAAPLRSMCHGTVLFLTERMKKKIGRANARIMLKKRSLLVRQHATRYGSPAR